MSVLEELLQKLKSADLSAEAQAGERREAHEPARELLCDFLQLAIDDLHSRDPVKRRLARWWMYEDSSTGIDTGTGYLSFQGTCGALELDVEAVRKALKTQPHNGNGVGEKNGAEKGNSDGRGRNPKPPRNRHN